MYKLSIHFLLFTLSFLALGPVIQMRFLYCKGSLPLSVAFMAMMTILCVITSLSAAFGLIKRVENNQKDMHFALDYFIQVLPAFLVFFAQISSVFVLVQVLREKKEDIFFQWAWASFAIHSVSMLMVLCGMARAEFVLVFQPPCVDKSVQTI